MNNLNVKKNVLKTKTAAKDTAGFATIGSLFEKFELEDKGGYITQEFQDFGYRMAMELDDLPHKSLYMRLSKTVDRLILERALSFVSDAQNAKSKAKLFMWKLKELRKEAPKKMM
jgi:hypothetical protein